MVSDDDVRRPHRPGLLSRRKRRRRWLLIIEAVIAVGYVFTQVERSHGAGQDSESLRWFVGILLLIGVFHYVLGRPRCPRCNRRYFQSQLHEGIESCPHCAAMLG